VVDAEACLGAWGGAAGLAGGGGGLTNGPFHARFGSFRSDSAREFCRKIALFN
jgi:hypothetical protein